MARNTKATQATVETESTAAPVVERTKESFLAEHKTKSAAIRALLAEGMKRGDIAKFLDIRYQHVRNVELTPLKKSA